MTGARSHFSRIALPLAAAGLCLALGGCAGTRAASPDARPWPKLAQKESLNIQVIREGTSITFTNTTAQAFGKSTIWLNQRYSRPIESLALGQTMSFGLTEFLDENSEPFRAGGFFAREAPVKLVLTQLETTDADGKPVLYGFVTVGRQELK